MVGMAIGAGRVARARAIAWTAGGVSLAAVGLVGGIIAVFPDLWVNLFTDDPGVRDASRRYLSTAAPMFAFIGVSISLYFSSQGAARVLGPVLAQTARLVFVIVGGWVLTMQGASSQSFFWLAAISMIVLGILAAAAVRLTRWGPKPVLTVPSP
jgi:Na+-driven multidrug efflux pump